MRRLRRTKALRELVRETELPPRHLVQPVFVVAGEGVREEVPSMPGIERFSISEPVGRPTSIQPPAAATVAFSAVPPARKMSVSAATAPKGVGRRPARGPRGRNPKV